MMSANVLASVKNVAIVVWCMLRMHVKASFPNPEMLTYRLGTARLALRHPLGSSVYVEPTHHVLVRRVMDKRELISKILLKAILRSLG